MAESPTLATKPCLTEPKPLDSNSILPHSPCLRVGKPILNLAHPHKNRGISMRLAV